MTKLDGTMPKKIHAGLPPNLTLDVQKGKFRYRSPLTGKRTWLGADRAAAISLAKKANCAVALKRQQRDLAPTIGDVIDDMLDEWIIEQGFSANYRKIVIFRLNAIKKDIGDLAFAEFTRKNIRDWLRLRAKNAETYNHWRKLFIEVWAQAMLDEIIEANEAEIVSRKKVSKELEANQKKRKRLTMQAFSAIHDHPDCPHFLKIAMEMSVVTLQARQEIVNMKLTDFKDDGHLYVVRQKTAKKTNASFIRIPISNEMDQIRRRSLDGIHSPYLVHKSPERRDPDKLAKKPHWSYIWPEQLTREFARVRELTGLFTTWPANTKPGFHEIRSLGARIYQESGYSLQSIQGLLAHADKTTSQIYTENSDALTADHYHTVQADMTLAKALKLDL